MCLAIDLILVANLRDDSSHLRIVNMTDSREEVVNNLEVQSAEIPSEQSILARKISGGPNLVNHPLGVNVFQQGRVLSLFDDMGQLEHYGDHQARDHRHSQIECHYNPPTVTQAGNNKRQAEEDEFPGNQCSQIPPSGPRKSSVPNLPRPQFLVVIVKMPLDQQQSVEEPKVIMLVTMVRT
jgi:hypothetical protein